MRIGLLSRKTLSEHHLRILHSILADGAFEVALVVADARPPRSVIRKAIDHLRRGRGGYILVLAAQKCFCRQPPEMPVEEFCRVHGIELLETATPSAPQTAAAIRRHHLDLLVLIDGFGIIREPLLSVCPRGILSFHHGDMRKYRGMPPGLWELYNGEKEIGITVQKISAGLDCGVPIEEKRISIEPNDTLGALRAKLRLADQGMLYAALKKVADPCFRPAPIHELGKVYTLPNLRQWLTLNLRILCRRWKL